MKNVLIGGGIYGWKNIGDDGLLRGVLKDVDSFNRGVETQGCEWLKNEFSDVIQFPLIQYQKPKYGCWLGNRKNINSWINSFFPNMDAYKWSDVLVCGGGTIFSACPWHAYRVTMLEKSVGNPTIIWGAGMCNETEASTIDVIKKWCSDEMVLHIFVRDELVKERLINIGVSANKISVCYDPAYVLEPEVFNDNGFLDEKARKMYSSSLKKLVLTISGESDISEKVNLDVFREFCLRAVEAGYEVFLIPISYSSHTKDRFFLSEIEKINSEHVTYIKEEFRPEQLIGFLKKINVTISSRLHMCMYSTIVGTPFVSLKRNDKNSDLAQLFNMPCIEFDAVDAETLLNVVSRIVNDEASIRCKVLLQAQRYRKVHKEKAEELCSYINKI